MRKLPSMWLVVPVALMLLWGLVSAVAGLFCDGILLSFEQPVPVAEVHRAHLVLNFTGRASLPLSIHSTKKLICMPCGMVLPDQRAHLATGLIRSTWTVGLPPLYEDCGQCRIEGQISYKVPGLIWPLSYEWVSDWFEPVMGAGG